MKDIFIPLGIILVVGSMLLPLPGYALDFLLAGNLVFALFLLLTALNISDALKLSALPSILLLATLFRLALNISTTRAILSSGDGGQVVEAFGSIVISGNIIVGLVVFAIITLVQFIVVAKGAERVAEVSARFTLDALPGKQMAIDADLRTGMLDHAAARRKRQELQMESKFYGALDGAMKFVKGDAVAGICITVINLIGGVAIGILSRGLDLPAALSTYAVLTVGDGLLSQIPALLNAISAGFVVTHVAGAEERTLSAALLAQVSDAPHVALLGALIVSSMALLPAMPVLPFICFGLLLLLLGAQINFKRRNQPLPQPALTPKILPLLRIEADQASPLRHVPPEKTRQAIEKFRAQFFETTGLYLLHPEILFTQGDSAETRVLLRGIAVAQLSVTTQPNETAEELNVLLLEVAQRHKVELIDDIFTRRLIDNLDRDAPELVAAAVPAVASITQITEVLKGLAAENVSLRNLDLIIQTISENPELASLTRRLLEEVRLKLRRLICAQYADTERRLRVLALDPLLELLFVRAEREGIDLPAMEVAALAELVRTNAADNMVLLCAKAGRRLLKDCLELRGVHIPVLAHEEICPELQVEVSDYLRAQAENSDLVEILAA